MTNETQWRQRPADAGQIVSIEYALDESGEYALRRTTDGSDGSQVVHRSEHPLDSDWTPYGAQDFAAPEVETWVRYEWGDDECLDR